jgi:chromate transport protein ChrA
MSIISSDAFTFILVVPFFLLIQWLVFWIYKKTNRYALALTPNLGLFVVGLVVSLILFIIGSSQPGNWDDLGLIIMLMMTVFATFASTITSVLLLYLLSKKKKTPTSK